MNIERFYEFENSMALDFINSFDKIILESDQSVYKDVFNRVTKDLKLNFKLISSFGAGIGSLYPIVESLIKNMSVNSIEITPESVVLATIASISIIYIEEGKFKSAEEESNLTKDSKSMLEELKMCGIGNGIVKKIIKSIKSINNIFNVISRSIGSLTSGVIDMFAYTSLLIPVLNGVGFIIGKYDLNVDSICQNFFGLSVGVGTIIAKNGISEIMNRIKGKFPIKTKEVVEEPIIKTFTNFIDAEKEHDGELIKEQ